MVARASAEPAWPSRQITIVSVSAPGGNSDVVARVFAQRLGDRLKVPVVVDNRPGASGGIASAFVAKSPPDGYTFVAGSIASHVIYPLIAKPLFDRAKDFVPVAMLASNSNVLVVPATSPFQTVGELLAAASKDPGSISFGSPGIGSSQHMSGELLQKISGVKLTHIPNVRGSVITDVMAGHIGMAFDGPSLIPQVGSGRLRPLAVTSKKRWLQLPDVPTMEQAGVPGFEVSSWQALYAPAGTPTFIVEALNREVRAISQLPEVVASFQTMGLTANSLSPRGFAEFEKTEIEKWASVVKSAGIKAN